VTGPDDPVGGPANDDDAVPHGESHDEAASGETVFDGEDVEAHVAEDGTAPTGRTLEPEEAADIERQVTEILIANQGRGPGEQVSVSPEDVN
jgi:hypothetical protein